MCAGGCLVLAIVAVLPYMLGSSDNNNNNNDLILLEISKINSRLDVIDYRLLQIETKIGIANNYALKPYEKEVAGNVTLTDNNDSFWISISAPVNNSPVTEIFEVEGSTNLPIYTDYYIYIISKLGDKYWTLTDGNNDANGHWRAYRDCIIPETYNNSILMAIISQKGYQIAESYDEVPEHISISDPIYINRIYTGDG